MHTFPSLLSSAAACITSVLFFYYFPALALTILFPRFRKNISFLAICGFYCVTFYLKPKAIHLQTVPLLLSALSIVLLLKKRLVINLKTLVDPPAIICLLYFFALFFFRWEPPSLDDPVKWASLSRLLLEYQVVPGDTRPLTQITHLSAPTLGIPVQAAITSFFGLLPLERVIFFWSSLSLFVFFELFALALENWFSMNISRWTALIAMLVFTNPQSYLTWGGTPTLLGFTGGLVILSLIQIRGKNPWKLPELVLCAMAISFSAYAHPIGIYLSVLIFVPHLIWNRSLFEIRILKEFVIIAFFSLLLSIPFLLTNTGTMDPMDVVQTRQWQGEMAPFLFRTDKSALYNLYTQMTSYVWNTAAIAAVILCVGMIFLKSRSSLFLVFLSGTILIGILISNTKWWILPLSPLIYPERAGTLWTLFLSLGIATFFEKALQKKWTLIVYCSVFVILAVLQFRSRLWPHWKEDALTANDVVVMLKLRDVVPFDHCIKIDRRWSGAWIPPIAFRCTVPSHPLNVTSLHEELKSQPKTLDWIFVSEKERQTKKREELQGKVVIDQGALLLKLMPFP